MRRGISVAGILFSATFAYAALTECGTSIPGTYRVASIYEQKTLVLRPDHTFRFHISSDVGTFWIVEGTWKVWDPTRPEIIETTVTEALVGSKTAPYSGWWSFGLWRISRGSVVPWDQYLARVSNHAAPREQQKH
jgi:hypothetical protein